MINFEVLEIEESSDNIFADLEIPNHDEYLAKAKLANRICELISQKKLTPTETEKLLGVDQSHISALMIGKLDNFSSEQLFRFLNFLDQEIEIVIKPKQNPNQQPTVRVIAVHSVTGYSKYLVRVGGLCSGSHRF